MLGTKRPPLATRSQRLAQSDPDLWLYLWEQAWTKAICHVYTPNRNPDAFPLNEIQHVPR